MRIDLTKNFITVLCDCLDVSKGEKFELYNAKYKKQCRKHGMFPEINKVEGKFWFDDCGLNVDTNRSYDYIVDYLLFILDGSFKKYAPPILDEIEREYLWNIIKPFRGRIRTITKELEKGYGLFLDSCSINIRFVNADGLLTFPPFYTDSDMYKGMKPNKGYTLKELDL